MQKLLSASFLAVVVFWSGYASAFGDGPFGPANGSDGVYWPAYRASNRASLGKAAFGGTGSNSPITIIVAVITLVPREVL